MKILVFAPFFSPDPTGSSVFAGQQANELTRRGHQVFVVTNELDKKAPTPSESEKLKSGNFFEVRRLKSVRVNLGRITWNYGIPVSLFGFLRPGFIKELKDFEPDIVVVHSTLFDLSLIGLLWARLIRTRVAIVSHTALWHDNSIVNSCMRVYGRFILRPIVRVSRARVVCVDKWTMNNALETFGNKNNTYTIPVSVELGTMSNGDAEKIRARHNLNNGPVILSLGHVIPLRNRINLMQSLPLLVEKYPQLQVVVVGMMKDQEFLQVAQELGVENHVIVAGAVPHHEIKDYLAAADVETHDLNGLGLGITSVEAMDAGVPIVAWAVDDNYPQFSLRSYGTSGFIENGDPESIAEKIDEILSNKEIRNAVVQSQRKLVDEIYSCESVTNQYLKLLSFQS